LDKLKFNPAHIFSVYLDKVASLHATSNDSSDVLFPSCRVAGIEYSLSNPVSYSNLQNQFKFKGAVSVCKIEVGLNKVGPHCLRRGRVTHAVRSGADHDTVMKAMRVKSRSIVLVQVSKLAF
jgi:integrase